MNTLDDFTSMVAIFYFMVLLLMAIWFFHATARMMSKPGLAVAT